MMKYSIALFLTAVAIPAFAADKPETKEALQARLTTLRQQNAEQQEINNLQKQVKAEEQKQADLQKPEASNPEPSQFVKAREEVKDAGKEIGKEVKHIFH